MVEERRSEINKLAFDHLARYIVMRGVYDLDGLIKTVRNDFPSLKLNPNDAPTQISFGGFELDLKRSSLALPSGGEMSHLTRLEKDITSMLICAEGEPVSRKSIMTALDLKKESEVNYYIYKIRRGIGKVSPIDRRRILLIRGRGYKITAE